MSPNARGSAPSEGSTGTEHGCETLHDRNPVKSANVGDDVHVITSDDDDAGISIHQPENGILKGSDYRHRDAKATWKLIMQDLDKEPVYKDIALGPGKYTWSLDYALPGTHTLPLYKALSSKEASILIQARTGKSHLNTSLYQIRVAEYAQCDCNQGEETVRHVLLVCSRWHMECQILRQSLGLCSGNTGPLLRAWNPQQDVRTGKYVAHPPNTDRFEVRSSVTIEFRGTPKGQLLVHVFHDGTIKTREQMNAENNARVAEDSRLTSEESLFPSLAQTTARRQAYSRMLQRMQELRNDKYAEHYV